MLGVRKGTLSEAVPGQIEECYHWLCDSALVFVWIQRLGLGYSSKHTLVSERQGRLLAEFARFVKVETVLADTRDRTGQ